MYRDCMTDVIIQHLVTEQVSRFSPLTRKLASVPGRAGGPNDKSPGGERESGARRLRPSQTPMCAGCHRGSPAYERGTVEHEAVTSLCCNIPVL